MKTLIKNTNSIIMKKTFKFLTILIVSIVLTACSNNEEENPQESTIAGEWSGTITGALIGTWNATIDNSGDLEGEINLDNRTIPLSFSGIQSDAGQFIGSAMDEESLDISLNGDFVGNTIIGFYTFGGNQIAGDWEGSRN